LDSNFRIQRFRRGETFAIVGLGEEPPSSGWAIRPDRAVFKDGVQVGQSGTFQRGSTEGVRGYSDIEYVPLDL
jgi:hypothetical protein